MRSTPIGGRPFPGFGYTGSMRAHSSRHGITRSISARSCARRVVFVYFSKPVPSVNCERLFISTSRSPVMWLVAAQHTPRESGSLIQRFLNPGIGECGTVTQHRLMRHQPPPGDYPRLIASPKSNLVLAHDARAVALVDVPERQAPGLRARTVVADELDLRVPAVRRAHGPDVRLRAQHV